jgi:hypothetical protein
MRKAQVIYFTCLRLRLSLDSATINTQGRNDTSTDKEKP